MKRRMGTRQLTEPWPFLYSYDAVRQQLVKNLPPKRRARLRHRVKLDPVK
jgi:hypothetical protein